MKKKSPKVTRRLPKVTPPPPPYPGRATPAHPLSRVSAKALESLRKLFAMVCSTPFVLARRIGGFIVFWRPQHFAWTLLTQFGAFFVRLEAQGHNVMKHVSQGTLNVRFERIQGSPFVQFWVHFC